MYSANTDDFIGMPTGFQAMRNSHLGRIDAAKHRIELLAYKVKTCSFGSSTRRTEEKRIRGTENWNTVAWRVFDSVQNQWAALIVFASKNEGALAFCIDYKKINGLTKEINSLTYIDKWIELIFTAKSRPSSFSVVTIAPVKKILIRKPQLARIHIASLNT